MLRPHSVRSSPLRFVLVAFRTQHAQWPARGRSTAQSGLRGADRYFLAPRLYSVISSLRIYCISSAHRIIASCPYCNSPALRPSCVSSAFRRCCFMFRLTYVRVRFRPQFAVSASFRPRCLSSVCNFVRTSLYFAFRPHLESSVLHFVRSSLFLRFVRICCRPCCISSALRRLCWFHPH